MYIENVEQEIWNDFEMLSHSSFETRGFENDFIHLGVNKKIEFDEDYKIDKFLKNIDNENIDWEELRKLYPNWIPIEIQKDKIHTQSPVKFRTHQERREIKMVIVKDWDALKEKLYNKIPDEKNAEDYLINIRWKDGVYCPKCNNTRIYIANGLSRFKCSRCGSRFSEKAGTLFHNTKLGLLKWYEAMYLLTSLKTAKISTHQLGDALNITQKTAWQMADKIKSKVKDPILDEMKFNLFK